jgi:hypothetical protein
VETHPVEVTTLRGYRCDVCKAETWDYQPHGWRRVQYDSRPMRPGADVHEQAEVCSAECELTWLKNRWNELNDEIKAQDNDNDN